MHILLNLQSPMQSWGDHTNSMTKGKNRGSYPFPTYSAILGILCSSMGINRDRHPEQYELLRKSFTYVSAYSKLSMKMITDYQTMGGGYDVSNKYQRKMIPCKSDGGFIQISKNANGYSNSKLSNRDYITDSRFMIVISVDDSIADDVISALKKPSWFPVLGRSSCIPSTRIFYASGSYDDMINLVYRELKNNSSDKLLIYESNKPTSRFTQIDVYDIPDTQRKGKYNHRFVYKTVV